MIEAARLYRVLDTQLGKTGALAAARIVIRAPERKRELLPDIERDLRAAGQIQQIDTLVSEALQVDVELAPPEGVPGRPE